MSIYICPCCGWSGEFEQTIEGFQNVPVCPVCGCEVFIGYQEAYRDY